MRAARRHLSAHTLWTIQAPLFPTKEVRITSNVFVIAPR